jgi:hypothetical protein
MYPGMLSRLREGNHSVVLSLFVQILEIKNVGLVVLIRVMHRNAPRRASGSPPKIGWQFRTLSGKQARLPDFAPRMYRRGLTEKDAQSLGNLLGLSLADLFQFLVCGFCALQGAKATYFKDKVPCCRRLKRRQRKSYFHVVVDCLA